MDDYVKWPLGAALFCAAALGTLALLVYGVGAFHNLDIRAFIELSAHHHSRPGELAETLTSFADPAPLLILLVAACVIALVRGRPMDALAAVTVVAGANVTTQVLKLFFAHPRAQTLFGGPGTAEVGFPSGHTTAAFSIGIAFAFVVPRELVPMVLALGTAFGIAVGVSVVVIAWHNPSDVIGGALVAAGWGFGVLTAQRAFEPRQSLTPGLSAPGSPPSR